MHTKSGKDGHNKWGQNFFGPPSHLSVEKELPAYASLHSRLFILFMPWPFMSASLCIMHNAFLFAILMWCSLHHHEGIGKVWKKNEFFHTLYPYGTMVSVWGSVKDCCYGSFFHLMSHRVSFLSNISKSEEKIAFSSSPSSFSPIREGGSEHPLPVVSSCIVFQAASDHLQEKSEWEKGSGGKKWFARETTASGASLLPSS